MQEIYNSLIKTELILKLDNLRIQTITKRIIDYLINYSWVDF